MGDSNSPRRGLQGVGPHVAPGSDHLAVTEFLQESADVFGPVFLPLDHIMHNIELIYDTTKPLNPNNTTFYPYGRINIKTA